MNRTFALGLPLPVFGETPWHDEMHEAFRLIDAAFNSIIGLANIKGPWKNTTAVEAGDRYYDGETNTFYEVVTNHVTAAAPTTFSEARAANPELWENVDVSAALTAAQTAVNTLAEITVIETNVASIRDAAAAIAGAALWEPNADYTENVSAVVSLEDQQTYRAKTTHSGVSTDPSEDATNWTKITGVSPLRVGDIILSGSLQIPDGFLRTNSAIYLQSEYPALFDAIGLIGYSDPLFKIADPATLPVGGSGRGVASSPDGNYLVVVGFSSPYITIYKKDNDDFTKLPDPASIPPSQGRGAAFSPDGVYLAIAHNLSPGITIYKRDGDTFTKLPDPAATLSGSTSVAFSPDGIYLAVAGFSSPYITIYKRDGDTFTKLPDPAALPADTCSSAIFSPDGVYLATAHDGSPYVTIYKRDGDDFVKLSDPSSLPTGDGEGVAFSPDGNYLAVAHDTTPYITIYKRNGDTFTKQSDPSSLPAGIGYDAVFSPNGNYLAVGHADSPYVTIYKRDGDVFDKLPDPASLPPNVCFGVTFSPDGNYLAAAHLSSPYVTIYATYQYDPDTEFQVPYFNETNLHGYIKAE